MSFKGIIVSCLLLLVIGSGSTAAAQGEVSLNFRIAISSQEAVDDSIEMAKNTSAFIDGNHDGMIDQVIFDGQTIDVDVDLDSAVGCSFEDGSSLVFYPTNLGWLPKSGTYEVLGFIHHWDAKANRFVALLIHQDENFDTSEGITTYIIDQAGIRIGSLFYAFMDKAFLRHTAPYKTWIETGQDFAIGSSPTVSNFLILGKDLGLMDTVLVINLSLVASATPPGQDMEIRKNEPGVVQASRGKMKSWDTITGLDLSAAESRVTVSYEGNSISGKINTNEAQGFAYSDGRKAVFYPSDMSALPQAATAGTNWQLLGLLHYFDADGRINAMIAVLLGQEAGEETTTHGAVVRCVDNTGLSVGVPDHKFFPRRSVKLMATYKNWEATNYTWALGYTERIDSKIIIVKDLGIVDSILVVKFDWY